jgi:hypothetical protein
MNKKPVVLAVMFLAITGCGNGESRPNLPEAELWDNPHIELPGAAFFQERSWMLDVSSWSAPGCGEGQANEARYMGDFGVGNGHAFALTGYACPLNTLHTMAGPDYQQEADFFRDTYMQLGPEPPEVIDGRVFRVRKTGIVIVVEKSEDLELTTVTFAPFGAGGDNDPVNRSIVRVAIVRNLGSQTMNGVQIVSTDASLATSSLERDRRLVLLDPGEGDPEAFELGDLAPGEEKTAVFAYVMWKRDGGSPDETIAALRTTTIDDLLEDTLEEWHRFVDSAAKLESPDPRVNDLLEGTLVTVRSQTAWTGAVSPMSRYSLMWIRDTAGVVRFYLKMGLFEQARAILDYYHLGAVMRGDIANALDLDLDPSDPPPEPDWASMPPFEGRTAGEVPSYLPLMAHWYSQATGDSGLVDEQYQFLKRALVAQNVDSQGLIGFSGDETYRGAMSMAFGLDIEPDYAGLCKSANSSFLFGAASEALAVEAEAHGYDDDAESLRARAQLVREAADRHYWTEGGYWAPFLYIDDPGNLPPAFEDVTTKPLWTGYTDADDERARENLVNVMAQIGRRDGFLQSPLDERYKNYLGFEVSKGVYTGMMPGYYLTNLALTDHPDAEKAFNALALAPSPSGNFTEYQVYDDYSVLQLIYEASGSLGDMTARYRPWEGSISLEGMLAYLTGFEPDAAKGAVSLAPRLPNNWPGMKWSKLRVGDILFDLELSELGGERRVTVTPSGQATLLVSVSVPLGKVSIKRVIVNGERLGRDDYTLWGPLGTTRVRLEPIEATSDEPLDVTVIYQ